MCWLARGTSVLAASFSWCTQYFLADAVDDVLNHTVDDSSDDPPSEDEILEALMKMKCGIYVQYEVVEQVRLGRRMVCCLS